MRLTRSKAGLPAVATLLAPFAACTGTGGNGDATNHVDVITRDSDAAAVDSDVLVPPADSACIGCDVTPPPDDGPGPDAAVHGVTNPEVLFEGTELDLANQYGLYIQDSNGRIDIVDDPAGGSDRVIRFRSDKAAAWEHVMVRPLDRRSGYRDIAQVTRYESAYHVRERLYVTPDAQWREPRMNLLEDYHCEPCEANSLQVMLNYDDDNSICVWIAYSTDPAFDPRGLNRGSSTDPWDTLGSGNWHLVHVAADGTATPPAGLPSTTALLLCRPDLHLTDIAGRWVDFEMVVRPSSYDTGVVMMWLDGRPYIYRGPNTYRWNQLDTTAPLPVNTFQTGLYGSGTTAATVGNGYFEIFATPPRIEVGDGIL